MRELQEEVGITVSSSRLFDKLEYQFPDRHITLVLAGGRVVRRAVGKRGSPGSGLRNGH